MSEERILELLKELHQELKGTEGLSEELAGTVQKLEADIADAVNPDVDTSENTILDDAIALEAVFAVSHPVAEKLIRDVINTLSRIGI
ncbi:MAG: DUF4404 family protein [Gammaproteobacteria bacterium]|nr:DUF4404 family protein [Gammaproteobacteria bacterium]MBT3860163.1 DUF4404 family protein [Gammaproteobacteria bacterium]MBT3987455.1 DUF4404 family protein [Gammaproteobacteria bacterium]MBT4257248.1 DUF4404 family protein [Gammaproteobacteria bacterium]MBT4581807.1 DUF4404 family protein [Gammaproteobacteria bacterium]